MPIDELIEANLELHEKLGKEVRINLENEAKIKRLERQHARYEEDIQYLYNLIEKLESQKACDKKELHSLRVQLADSHTRLKNSERLCNEKEKFILFRESQLLESEDAIYRLKQQIVSLSTSEMARARTDLISLETLGNDRLLEEIQNDAERLYLYAMGGERLPNIGTAQRLRDRTRRASELIHNSLANELQQARNALRACEHEGASLKAEIKIRESENHRLEVSLEGASIEIKDNEHTIAVLHMEYDEITEQLKVANNRIGELDGELREAKDRLYTLLQESERLEGNYDRLIAELQRNLEQARRDVAERDILLNQYNVRLRNCQHERGIIATRYDVMLARYRTEQIITRSLTRQRMALKIANRQLQIRLMNPPAIIPPHHNL